MSNLNREGRQALSTLQAMRAIAALAVVFFHTDLILGQYGFKGSVTLANLASAGWIGVNFFFILSGFIILHAHYEDIGAPRMVWSYLRRRFVRLYPIYWILLSCYIAGAMLGIGRPDFKWEAEHMVSAYTLVMVVDEPTLPLKVAWTLLFEVKFYIIFSLLIISPKFGALFMIAWGIAVLIRACFDPPADWGYLLPDYGMLSIWNVYFFLGLLARFYWDRILKNLGFNAAVLFSLSTVALLLISPEMSDATRHPIWMIAVGIALAGCIISVTNCEIMFAWRAPRWAVLLGNASYSIYLSHSAMISLAAVVFLRNASLQNYPTFVFITVFMASVVGGVIIHIALEQPLLKWFKMRFFVPNHRRHQQGPDQVPDS